MDSISNPMDGKYTESKLVFFEISYTDQVNISDGVYSYGEADKKIAEFVKDGWTPTNMTWDSSCTFAILFCR